MKFIRRRFPHNLPTFDFHVNIILGRYVLLAERDGLSLYDLDASDVAKPSITFQYETMVPTTSYLSHQVNAGREGPNVIWVAFQCYLPTRMYVICLVSEETIV